jgi:acylphosphatase
MARPALAGRRYTVHGRVQGVGFRDFIQREARRLKVTGYARNLDDGSVLVCAVAPGPALAELESALHRGPRWAEVRGVRVDEMPVQVFSDFRIV